MANHKSAEKRTRQTETRTAVNRIVTSKARTAVRKVDDALKAGDVAVATESLKKAQSTLAKTAKKGIVKKNTVARKTSRLNAKVKKAALAAKA